MDSLKRGYPCRPDGTIVPWMNYSTIHFFRKNGCKKISKLFEFGSGYSYPVLCQPGTQRNSVESDKHWFKTVKGSVPDNVQLIFQADEQDDNYCRSAIQTGQRYDVIIIDGKDRVNCLKQSLPALTDRGGL